MFINDVYSLKQLQQQQKLHKINDIDTDTIYTYFNGISDLYLKYSLGRERKEEVKYQEETCKQVLLFFN